MAKKIEKNYLSYYQKSNQGRDILYQSHIQHYATAPDTKTLSSNASTALSPNKSQPGKFLLTCNINREEKGPKWFFLWFYERKFNNLSLHFIRLLWRRVPQQQLCILLNSLQTSANNKSVFHFSLRTPHVCLIEETWMVWERILTRVSLQFRCFISCSELCMVIITVARRRSVIYCDPLHVVLQVTY